MRIVGFVGSALVAALALAPRPSAAAYDYPWCAKYYDRSGIFSCAFATYGQCMATISGVGGLCMQNPSYTPPPPPYVEYRHPKRHHHAANHT